MPLNRLIRDPRLDEAAAVFDGLFTSGREIGASFAVFRHGELLAHCWGGTTEARGETAWREDTLVQVYSTGKPLVALAALLAVSEGTLTLDDPVTTWWPAYADHPTRPTTLRMILAHTSGKHRFPQAAAELTAVETGLLIGALGETPPLTPPGSTLFEHAATYGHLVDGLLAAADAPSVAGRAEQISSALGIDLRFGVPISEHSRVADLEVTDERWLDDYLAHPDVGAALTVPHGLLETSVTRSPEWRRTSFGAVGLTTDAASLAAFYDDVHRPDGRIAQLLGADLHRQMVSPAAEGHDGFLRQEVVWGLGFRIDGPEIGMGGIGGSAAWYSAAGDYSMAYVTRGLADHSRVDDVADAVEAALARG